MKRLTFALLLVCACGGSVESAQPSTLPADSPDATDHPSNATSKSAASASASASGSKVPADNDPSRGQNKCAGKAGQSCAADETCVIPDGPNTDPPWGFCYPPAQYLDACGAPPFSGGGAVRCAEGLYCLGSTCVKDGMTAVPPETAFTNFSVAWHPSCGANCPATIELEFDITEDGITYGMGGEDTPTTIGLNLHVHHNSPGATAGHRHERIGTANVVLGRPYELIVKDGHSNELWRGSFTAAP